MNLSTLLRHRIDIQKGIDTPNSDGGLDRSYETLATLWAGLRETGANIGDVFISVIRGEQVASSITHEFTVRKSSVEGLGKEFTTAYDIAFKKMADMNPVKSEYFVFMRKTTAYKGRLFRIKTLRMDDNHQEWIKIRCSEIEEHGTGWPE